MNLKKNTLGIIIIVAGLATMFFLIKAMNRGGDFNGYWVGFIVSIIAFIASIVKLVNYSSNTPR